MLRKTWVSSIISGTFWIRSFLLWKWCSLSQYHRVLLQSSRGAFISGKYTEIYSRTSYIIHEQIRSFLPSKWCWFMQYHQVLSQFSRGTSIPGMGRKVLQTPMSLFFILVDWITSIRQFPLFKSESTSELFFLPLFVVSVD